MGETNRKLFVLDTNILLHEPFAIFSFQEHDVVIPMTVLEELDRIKDSKRDVARDARIAIRTLEDLFREATPDQISEGIPFTKDIKPQAISQYSLIRTKHWFAGDKAGDNPILNAVLLQNKRAPREVVLITKDINMRLRAKGAGVRFVEDYQTDQLIDDIQYLTKGFQQLEGIWDGIDNVESKTLAGKTFHTLAESRNQPSLINM